MCFLLWCACVGGRVLTCGGVCLAAALALQVPCRQLLVRALVCAPAQGVHHERHSQGTSGGCLPADKAQLHKRLQGGESCVSAGARTPQRSTSIKCSRCYCLHYCRVVYTPWSNLKKTNGMEVGQVAFHNDKLVRVCVGVVCGCPGMNERAPFIHSPWMIFALLSRYAR